MSVDLLAILRRSRVGDGYAPTLRVRCSRCLRIYQIRSWPSALKGRAGCQGCTGKRARFIFGTAWRRCSDG